MRNFCLMMFCFGITFSSIAQDILGQWKTIDDETGIEKSIVEIYQKEGKIYGKIIEIFNKSKRDLLCSLCEDEDYNKPVLGLVIIKDMEEVNEGLYKNGTITNPDDGKIYTCRLKLDEANPNRLEVRGYISFFYRTQHWVRID